MNSIFTQEELTAIPKPKNLWFKRYEDVVCEINSIKLGSKDLASPSGSVL